MFGRGRTRVLLAGMAAALIGPIAGATTITFDTADDGVTPLVNGQDLEATSPFGTFFNLTTSGPNLGAAIYDSTPGVNSADPDLAVGFGNLLILQNNYSGNKFSGSDVFSNPNDDPGGGFVVFDFDPAGVPVTVESLDVVDVDAGGRMIIKLYDSSGNRRVVDVPDHFTGDVNRGDVGYATIDLLSGLAQESPDKAGLFTSVYTDSGFNPEDIVKMKVKLTGSGALDNLTFTVIPLPAAALLGIAGLAGVAIRRRFTA